jgi:2-polyprenyl-3-methyl-5-hydroxy-6-metoxy-1,4-benzoquinol methylase
VVATESQIDVLTERLFGALIATFDVASVALGLRLGYYEGLRDLGTATSAQLAQRVGANERYTREWLEHQASTGLIEVESPSESGTERTYRLIPGTAELFTDTTGEAPIVHFVRSVMASVLAFEDVAECFRSGKGLPFGHYGEDMRIGQALGTRWGYMNDLVNDWLPAMPDLHERLSTKADAKIADIGFGAGWSSIAMARAYPNARVDGLDLDAASVELAQGIARDEGLSDRVQFRVQDAGDPVLAGQYDLVTAFECVHDMANPIQALSAMRSLVGPGGTVLIVDENVNDTFEAPGSDIERIFYGYSLFHCLPGSMDGPDPAGTGTVMRQSTLRGYAEKAGFQAVDLLPIENDFFRFYRLTA